MVYNFDNLYINFIKFRKDKINQILYVFFLYNIQINRKYTPTYTAVLISITHIQTTRSYDSYRTRAYFNFRLPIILSNINTKIRTYSIILD